MQRAVIPDSAARRRPQRQVPAGRMASDHKPVEVERIIFGYPAQRVDRRGGVQKRPRKPAALMAQPPVLDIPHRYAVIAQVRGDIVHQDRARNLGQPAAAMHHHHSGKGTFALRQPQLTELLLALAIGDLCVRFLARAFKQLVPAYGAFARMRVFRQGGFRRRRRGFGGNRGGGRVLTGGQGKGGQGGESQCHAAQPHARRPKIKPLPRSWR